MLPMRELVPMMEKLGCTDVKAYLQSGNVVFSAAAAVARTLEAKLEKAISEKFGFEVPVTLRSQREMEAVVAGNPHVAAGLPLDRVYVVFLKGKPVDGGFELVHAKAARNDALHCEGRDLFLHLPGGIADTKLTNVFMDAKLQTVSTLRNWNTVLAVMAMLRG